MSSQPRKEEEEEEKSQVEMALAAEIGQVHIKFRVEWNIKIGATQVSHR